jgi:hypothetical protein
VRAAALSVIFACWFRAAIGSLGHKLNFWANPCRRMRHDVPNATCACNYLMIFAFFPLQGSLAGCFTMDETRAGETGDTRAGLTR